MLDAAFTELEGAIELLRVAGAAPAEPGRLPPAENQPPGGDNAERSLLRAVFQDAPVPLFLLTRDGTVQRVNRAAGDLIGAKPGYATGRPFTVFVGLPSRAAVNSQLTAVGRTGKQRSIRCSLVAEDGPVPCELVIGRVGIRGHSDEADPLMIAVRDAAVPRSDESGDTQAKGADRPRLGAVRAITRRLDLVTAVARLLLENEGFSESRTLQRCARLIARELTAWVIVDMERRHRVRRWEFVAGPDDPGLAELTSVVAAVDPPPGSVPCTVHESGRPALIAHAEDAGVLGLSLEGEPLLNRLDATSVLSVPLADGETRYGVLTLLRRPGDGHFKVADLALVTELGEQMALAIRVNRMFRRRSETVDALHASLQPRRWPEIPGVEIAAMYLAAAEDPELGGDFYDVYQTPDGWGLAVGDVCGKGEEAAAVTAAARYAIRVLARRCADPGAGAGPHQRDRAGGRARVGRRIRHGQHRAPDLAGRQAAGGGGQRWPPGRGGAAVGRAGPDDERRRPAARRLFPDAEPVTQELSMAPVTSCSCTPAGWPRRAVRQHLLPGPAGR